MTLQQYRDKVFTLEKELEAKLFALRREYAFSTTPYTVGDIVTDHIGSIIVERMSTVVGRNGVPQVLFNGPEFTKNGVIRKDGRKRTIWQENLLE